MRKTILLILPLLLVFACQKPDLAPDVSETYWVRTAGADMPVYVRGNTASKKLILVIHGGPGGQAWSYSLGRWADQITQDHALLLWDQRGQGASQGHYSKDIVNIERMRLDLKAVVQATRERYGEEADIYLMGHSWGGLLGTAFAQSADQHMVQGWIEVAGAHDLPLLYSSAYTMLDTTADQELAAGRQVEFWNEVKEGLADLPETGANLDHWLSLNRFGHDAGSRLGDVHETRVEQTLGESVFQNPQDGFAQLTSSSQTGNLLLEEVVVTNLTPTMSQIQIPTLLLWGKYDFVVPPSLGATALPLIRTADKDLYVFQHSAHSPMYNEPEEFVRVLADWISRH